MIVAGAISGIQEYLFDVADEGGGQARRLRARSFFIQLLAEAASLRAMSALGWSRAGVRSLLSGAGKFVLSGPIVDQASQKLRVAEQAMSRWLLQQLRGELRLSLGWSEMGDEVIAYSEAMGMLQKAKSRGWSSVAITANGWDPSALVLPPLDQPCSLCAHQTAEYDEYDQETSQTKRVCRRCTQDRALGQMLPRARWLTISDSPDQDELDLFGLGAALSSDETVPLTRRTVTVTNLVRPDVILVGCPPDIFLPRQLMSYIPVQNQQPIMFVDLARKARGDCLLGVLKADADSLGLKINRLLQHATSLQPVASLSGRLDRFFTGRLKQELEAGANQRFRLIYTVFAGGDDLLLVGPWDVMLDFAGRVNELFQAEFSDLGLSISGGLAIMKPKRPIKHAVAEASRLLDEAKQVIVHGEVSAKDQLAAFGEIWKWKHHAAILQSAMRLADWVANRDAERGWLHTWLKLTEASRAAQPDSIAISRLAAHIARNCRRGSAIREWAESLVEDFDDTHRVETRYLPGILRYALTATRTPTQEE
ncbi:MAG TPA: type III-A CRISPR-associated protein Cas10/Csm1 [Verrucomicrobiae bacterium]|nr:type III-A CRISPR-associated protein Cas10/Csm1 [Verrucomicrobiae bacterium]